MDCGICPTDVFYKGMVVEILSLKYIPVLNTYPYLDLEVT